MIRTVRNRLERLDGRTLPPGDCDGNVTCIVCGDELPPFDARRCPMCGEVHLLRIRTVIVGPDRRESPDRGAEPGPRGVS